MNNTKLTLNIDKELKKQFRLWCINHNKTMSQVIEEKIKEIVTS